MCSLRSLVRFDHGLGLLHGLVLQRRSLTQASLDGRGQKVQIMRVDPLSQILQDDLCVFWSQPEGRGGAGREGGFGGWKGAAWAEKGGGELLCHRARYERVYLPQYHFASSSRSMLPSPFGSTRCTKALKNSYQIVVEFFVTELGVVLGVLGGRARLLGRRLYHVHRWRCRRNPRAGGSATRVRSYRKLL